MINIIICQSFYRSPKSSSIIIKTIFTQPILNQSHIRNLHISCHKITNSRN